MTGQQDCHQGYKTARAAERSIEQGRICDNCGGDPRRPTGLVFISREQKAMEDSI